MPYFTWDMIGNNASWLTFIFALIFSNSLSGQSVQSSKSHLDAFLKDPCLQSASIGFELRDLEGEGAVLAHQPDLSLPPASILKLITTIRALKELGSEFTFKTLLGHNGKVRGDTLMGDLVIQGFGDPTLGSHHHPMNFEKLLSHWSKEVTNHGINHITGDVIGDASYFTRDRWVTSWPHEDLGNYYGAVPCGLNINDNSCKVRLRQNQRIGDAVDIIDVDPIVPDLTISSVVTSGAVGSGDQAYIIGAPLQSNRYIRGTIPVGQGSFTIKGSLPDPPKFLAFHLKSHLAQQGVTVLGSARSQYRYVGSRTMLDQVNSVKLSEIVQHTNLKSINLYAEGMGMMLDKIRSKDGMSADTREFWTNHGIDFGSTRLVDHCGLAPDNAISAKTMVEVLQFAFNDKILWKSLIASLPTAGQSGTLSNMFRNSPAKGSIFAKSGLINGVRNYAGYIKSKSGKWMAFCVMTLNPSCSPQVIRKKLEQLLESLYLSLP